MSYNISKFNVKKLDNLKIPIDAFYLNPRKDWWPDRTNNDDGSVTLCNLETEINGIIEGEFLLIDKISCHGEGSGTVMNDMLEPAFKKSIGEFVAVCVWEGGDSINKLSVKDGSVNWDKIEL